MPYVRSYPKTYATHPNKAKHDQRLLDIYPEDTVTEQKWKSFSSIERSVTYPFYEKINFDIDRYLELKDNYKEEINTLTRKLTSLSYTSEERKQIAKDIKTYVDSLLELEQIFHEKYS